MYISGGMLKRDLNVIGLKCSVRKRYFKIQLTMLPVRGHSTTTWTEFCHYLNSTTLRGQFSYPEHGQKQTFFDPFPPHLVHADIERPLRG